MRYILCLSVICVVGLVGWRLPNTCFEPCVTGDPSASTLGARDEERAEETHPLRTYREVTLLAETPEFTQVLRYFENESVLTIVDTERPGRDGREVVSESSQRVDYAIRAVAGRQAHEFYVLGRSASGECIVERFTQRPSRGSYTVRRARAETAIGVPVAGVPATVIGVEGGAYVSVADRGEPIPAERTVLLRTKDLGMPHGITCDPEGRFVLLLCGDESRTLFQLALTANATPVELFDSRAIVHLRHCEPLQARQHAVRGRVYTAKCIWCPSDAKEHTTFLFDADNDGRFEGHETSIDDECTERGYALHPWLTDFQFD